MPVRLCLVPSCGLEATQDRRCVVHSRANERSLHPRTSIYSSRRWRALRKRQLFFEPLCRVCGVVATDVDHVRDIEDGGAVWDRSNLESLCHSCHSLKTRMTQVRRVAG